MSAAHFPLRRTMVVHTKLAGRMARVDAARTRAHGVQIMTMGQLAGRLAGGFFKPIDQEDLQDAVRDALICTNLGELEGIKVLPGMVWAAVNTFNKIWSANIDLALCTHPRTKALAALERGVLQRLPPFQKRPCELVEIASSRLPHAAALLGEIEVLGHSEMPLCWRSLLESLSKVIRVHWIAGPRSVPEWLDRERVSVATCIDRIPQTIVNSCANPYHEALEAFRWARELLAHGIARPEEIAVVAANPLDFDDYVLSLSNDAGLPVHFVHGIKAMITRDGQAAAALAEILVKGISQDRVRRLFALLGNQSEATKDLPAGWHRGLPKEAPLTTFKRWEEALAQLTAADWPDGIDRSDIILHALKLMEKGLDAADEVGEILPRRSRALWRRALKDGPAQALPVTLTQLRVDDELEAASHVIWTSAISLASAPRPYVRLLALNAGRWPRRICEDRLIPDHIIPVNELDPLPLNDADKRDFATILASATSVSISFSRGDVEGRLLGRSPLIHDMKETYLSRGRTPKHAGSEADRLLARPSEFGNTPIAISGFLCWRDWNCAEISTHDGLVGQMHPRIQKVLAAPQSATSLRLLLRDPIRFVWKYALGWRQPEEADEPLSLDALGFGNLVHGILQKAVNLLEGRGGLRSADKTEIETATRQAVEIVRKDWEREQPVPPQVIWEKSLCTARQLSLRALQYSFPELSNQKIWTEIPFGTRDGCERKDLPWELNRSVEIPGTNIVITGLIDRLDLSSDGTCARVIDYKTGDITKNMPNMVINGGKELQRCLYAFAAKTLLNQNIELEASLFYPGAKEDDQALFPLQNIDATLASLAKAIGLAKVNLEEGNTLPGIDAGDQFNDLSFALPANASYLSRKATLVQSRLGDAVTVWDAE